MCLEVENHPSIQAKGHLHQAVLFPDMIRVRYACCVYVVHGWNLSVWRFSQTSVKVRSRYSLDMEPEYND